jgi:hypothetical protein
MGWSAAFNLSGGIRGEQEASAWRFTLSASIWLKQSFTWLG